jgi:hypothetical protein
MIPAIEPARSDTIGSQENWICKLDTARETMTLVLGFA